MIIVTEEIMDARSDLSCHYNAMRHLILNEVRPYRNTSNAPEGVKCLLEFLGTLQESWEDACLDSFKEEELFVINNREWN